MYNKILITGGSGFIASHVARVCLERKHKVILQSRAKSLPPCLQSYDSVKLFTTSFLSSELESLKHIDCIIHLASAGISPRKAEWSVLEDINIKGTLVVCQLAKRLKARLVIAGSYAEYGNSGLRYDKIPVDAPLEPTFPYAVSKAAGCQLSLGYARSEKLHLAYLRIFNAFGHGQHGSNLWPALLSAAELGKDFDMTKGEQVRDFVPVEAVANYFADVAVEKEMLEGSPYVANIGSGRPQTVRQFSEYWWNKTNAKGLLKVGSVPYRNNEVMRFVPCLKHAYL